MTRAAVPLGAVVALVENNSAWVRANAVTSIMNSIAPIYNRTAVYALNGSGVVSQAKINFELRENAQRMAAEAENEWHNRAKLEQGRHDEERRLGAWRRTIAIGTHTNCGLVIDLRGQVVQVQLPADATSNGTRVHLIERDPLADVDARRECRF